MLKACIFATVALSAMVAALLVPLKRPVEVQRSCIGVASDVEVLPVSDKNRYYVILFASQNRTNASYLSHVFATFVKVDEEDNIDERTISWLPATLHVRMARRLPEAGVNLGLSETLAWIKKTPGISVVRMGPYPIDQALFYRATRQIDRLNSGRVQYKMLDRFHRGPASNCIHAVADVYPDNGVLYTNLRRGMPAAVAVKQHLSPFIQQGQTTADYEWIARRLEVDSMPVIDR